MQVLDGLGAQLIGILVIVLGLVGAFFGIKRSGKKEAEAEQLSKSFEQAKRANEITQNVSSLPPDKLADELRKHQRD